MAQIIPSFANKHSRGSYPSEWFDGSARRLIRGIDFHCTVPSLRAYLSVLAKKHNVRIATANATAGSLDIEARRRR